MKVGIDINKAVVFVALTTDDGITSTVGMTANVARAVANQLTASANVLDAATEAGELAVDGDSDANS